MREHCRVPNFIPYYRLWVTRLAGYSKLFLTVLTVAFFITASAQTVVLPPADIDCPSKDLEVTRAILPAPASDPCRCDGTRLLQLGIINKTGSERASFAMWGKLIRRDPFGNQVGDPVNVFACAPSIKANSTAFYETGTSIQVNCNESLVIVDVILAWTSANKKETCDVLKNSPSTINPKCGRVDSIRIETGVAAEFVSTNATCTSGGSIRVTPYGGTAPYRINIGTDVRTGISAGGSTTFTGLTAGSHSVTVTDSRNCPVTQSINVGSTTPPTAEAGTGFTKTCTQNATGGAIGEPAEDGFSYSWTSSPAGFTSTLANPTVNPSVTTSYTVRKTHIATGCYDEDAVTVTVTTGAETADAGSDFTKTCTGNTNGGAIGVAATAGYSYSWSSSPVGFSSADANPTVNPAVTTTYTVRKTNTTTGCYDDDDVTVTVNTTAPDFSVCLVQPSLCANSGSVTITASGGSGFSYSIDNGANWSANNVFSGLGSGSVTGIKVKNSDGCVSAVANCEASECPETAARSTRTVSSSQPATLTAISTADISEILADQLTAKAFPNPYSDKVRLVVSSPVSGNGSIEVMNMLGQRVKTVYQGRIIAGSQAFDINIPPAHRTTLVYIVKMDGKQVTGKLLQLKQ